MPKIYKSILVLGDGTEIAAGDANNSAVFSLTYTATVSNTTDLCPGAACSNKIEFKIWVQPGESLTIASGTQISYYRQDLSTNDRTLVGTFWAVKPTRASRNTYKVYAYDAVSKLDGIQSTWLRSIQDNFPMTLWSFAQLVAQRCSLTISNTVLPRNGDYQVQAFYADNLTGRQLLSWVAEASGTFLRATPDGKLEFSWYTPDSHDTGIMAGDQGVRAIVRLSGDVLRTSQDEIYRIGISGRFYYQSSLTYEDYQTEKIDKVQIKQTDDDVGVIYPPDETGTNALVISGNLLLTTSTAETLQPVAQSLYGLMADVTYTPCEIEIQDDGQTHAGDIVEVTDSRGNAFTTYVMEAVSSGGRLKLTCTGNASRDGTAAVNEQSYTNLQGRVLEISASVDGLKITNRDLQGSLASLELTVDGIETNVQKQIDDLTDYVDTETGQIKDEAVNEAVQQAVQQVDQSLTFYATKVEMNSAIEQSASQINLSVSQKLTGYSTTTQMQQYVNGQTSGILQDAQDYTDSELERYPTTIEMNSAIQQSASNINLSVDSKLTMYPTNSEMQDYVDDQTANLPTTSTVQNMIDIGIDGITLSATTNGNSSTIILRHDGAQISSANITFTGFVTFSDLSGSGTSTINGDNITTGQIGSASGNTLYDLDAGTLRTGRSSGNHVNINDRGITWYVLNGSTSYLTGVLYSVYGESWIGANSNYVNYGWANSATPSSYRGMRVDNTGSRVSFNTSHVDVESGDLGVSGGISTRNLNAWGSKNRIVCTHLGNLAFAAMESPEPAFCDWGGGEVGEDGICPIVLTPEYAAAITGQALRWLVTPVGGDGGLWVERTDCGALVHGTPGSRFDWLCIGVQRDMAGLYAPVSGTAPPPERDDAAELAKTASMAEEISEHDYYKEADIA